MTTRDLWLDPLGGRGVDMLNPWQTQMLGEPGSWLQCYSLREVRFVCAFLRRIDDSGGLPVKFHKFLSPSQIQPYSTSKFYIAFVVFVVILL